MNHDEGAGALTVDPGRAAAFGGGLGCYALRIDCAKVEPGPAVRFRVCVVVPAGGKSRAPNDLGETFQ